MWHGELVHPGIRRADGGAIPGPIFFKLILFYEIQNKILINLQAMMFVWASKNAGIKTTITVNWASSELILSVLNIAAPYVSNERRLQWTNTNYTVYCLRTKVSVYIASKQASESNQLIELNNTRQIVALDKSECKPPNQ